MSEAFDQPVPRGPLLAAGALILVTLLGVGWSRYLAPAPANAQERVVKVRALLFEDRPDGSVAVFDARTRTLTETLAPGADGFVRATLRTMARERQRRGIGPEVPFELAVLERGRVVLVDPASGRTVDLEAFGSTNFAAFARLLATDPPKP